MFIGFQPQAISYSIIQMTNLEELSIQDTQLHLGHLPKLQENSKLPRKNPKKESQLGNHNSADNSSKKTTNYCGKK